jgi:curli biogenesis system outer membrane secretion channel CsgG
MNLNFSAFTGLRLLAASLLCSTALLAQETAPAAAPAAAPGMKTLGIAKVKATPAILANAAGADRKNSVDRMTQALDGQLISAVQQTRKFTVLARSDSDALIEEAGATGKSFSFGEANYLLVVTVDDFQDFIQTAAFAALGKTATKRVIRFSAIGKIYETKTNKLIESANFQEQNLDTEELLANSASTGGELSDALLLSLTRRMSEQIAQRVADVIYPAKIMAKTGKVVTLNRGDGTAIAVGQLWEVFALGEEMTDPDTGASLGREEVSVGMVRITRVTAKTSQAEINGEDLGIDKGAIVRRVVQ